jgi:hypothetical protein
MDTGDEQSRRNPLQRCEAFDDRRDNAASSNNPQLRVVRLREPGFRLASF